MGKVKFVASSRVGDDCRLIYKVDGETFVEDYDRRQTTKAEVIAAVLARFAEVSSETRQIVKEQTANAPKRAVSSAKGK